MRDELLVRLTDAHLDPSEALAFVASPGAGGTVLFAGTVRDHSKEGHVTALEYEAWEERATSRLVAVGEEILDRWPVSRAAILHRTGNTAAGGRSVIVC